MWPLEEHCHVGEAIVEVAEHDEDEGVVKNDFPKITKSVNHPFEMIAIVKDGEITMNEVTKLDVKDEWAHLTVADKLLLNLKPEGVCHQCERGGDLDELGGDSVVEPRIDNAVHLPPMRVGSGDGVVVGDDMVREPILAECVEEESLPPIVVWWNVVKLDGDHRLDVETDGLSVEGGDHGVGLTDDARPEDIVITRRRWSHDGRLA
jgi:hypothetical protein